jgi:hypothetical protein
MNYDKRGNPIEKSKNWFQQILDYFNKKRIEKTKLKKFTVADQVVYVAENLKNDYTFQSTYNIRKPRVHPAPQSSKRSFVPVGSTSDLYYESKHIGSTGPNDLNEY